MQLVSSFGALVPIFRSTKSNELWDIYLYSWLLRLPFSNNITMLFIGRFVQAFGASTGSVTTQTILRDNYHGNDRHHLFAKISAALAFSPAIGPLIGGFIGQYYGFRVVFYF